MLRILLAGCWILQKQNFMAASQEEQIEQIFNSFDKDKSGTIELNELKGVAQALGEKLTDQQIRDIVKKLDTDGDGTISLSEFKFWWMNGLKGKLGDLVYLKAKAMKMTKDFMGQFDKAGINLKEFDKDTEIDIFNLSVSCGKPTEEGMKVDASIYHRGDRFKQEFGRLKSKASWLNEKSGNFVMVLPCDDPKKAKEEMQALVNALRGSGQVPVLEGQGTENPYLGIKFETAEKCLIFHLQIKEAIMALFEGPTSQFDTIDSLFDEKFYIYAKIIFETNFSIDDLLEKDNIVETVLKGFSLSINGEAPNCVMKKYRELVESSGKSEGSLKFLLSLLMKNVFLNLKFKSPSSIEKFYNKIGIQDILKECPNLADLLEQFSLIPEIQQVKFKTEDPRHLLYQVMKCIKNNINSGIEIYLQRKQTLVAVQTSLPNAHKIFNIIFNEC